MGRRVISTTMLLAVLVPLVPVIGQEGVATIPATGPTTGPAARRAAIEPGSPAAAAEAARLAFRARRAEADRRAAAARTTNATPLAADALARVRANVRAIVRAGGVRRDADPDLATMQPDGSWADQDYRDTDRVRWRAIDHLPRLERITRDAYAGDRPPDAQTLERIVTSLGFWLDADPLNDNWWHNEIGVPRRVGMILTILGDDAPPELRTRGAALMRRADWQEARGANLLDMTWIGLMRGCIEGDPAFVAEAFERSWAELRIVGPYEEGIHADGSFLQHGPLLYNMSYGSVLMDATLRTLAAARGSGVRPPDAVFDALATFALDGNAWMVRGGAWDWSAGGRAIVRPQATLDHTRPQLAALAAHAAGPRAGELRAAATRPAADAAPIGNRHFWRSDYQVHRRPGFFASFRMLSTRTANTDVLTNGENKQSHHIADGAMTVMRDGQEYFDIYPVWDWQRIPGTTVESGRPMPIKAIRRYGSCDAVGGVSDGTFGCAGMDFALDALRSRKAWFCFDDRVVCLGAGITSDSGREVVTTLNQSFLRGEIHADGAADAVAPGERSLAGARWLWHDGVGYVVLDGATFRLAAGPRTGAWADIGVGPAVPITRDVFCATISHGTSPTDARYAYVVLPDATPEATAGVLAAQSSWSIVNTPAVQAAGHGGHVQAIFYEPGDTTIGSARLGVDRPAAVMLRRDGDAWQLSVASLTNREETIRVTVEAGGTTTTQAIDLPGDRDAGRSVTRRIPPAGMTQNEE